MTINGTTGAISTSPYTYSPAADNVKSLINAIGTVEYTAECKAKIDAARVAYEALADYSCDAEAVNALKAAVSNYSTLTAAEEAYDDLLLQELYNALGDEVWTGYGAQTGVISYSRGDQEQEFRATFMGGMYVIDLPFGKFTAVSKSDNGDGSYTYDLTVNLPAQTGMSQETLHVTVNNGHITAIESENAGISMSKEGGEITSWADLQAAMNNGGIIKLGANITASGTDAALTVPAGKTVVVDLNGKSIDRALTSAAENGSVIINNGTLAIKGDGTITGGNTTGNGGGILNNGTLTIYSGIITGNNAAAQGGGVYNSVANNGTVGFWMTGGLIDGNTASSYPAIK